MILVITHERDMHGKHILDLLRRRGEDALALDYGTYPQQLEISAYSSSNGEELFFNFPDGKVVNGSEVKSVLNRRQGEVKISSDFSEPKIVDYIVRESRHFLDALPQMLPCFWLSNPDTIRIAGRKPYQLVMAKRLGFLTPSTITTNSPIETERFVMEAKNDIACKSLWTPGITVERDGKEVGITLYTRRLKPFDVVRSISNVKNCPMIFQEYVEKSFELRITVVGKKVFPCAIYSQKSTRAKEDWRRYDLANTPHEQHELPADIKEKCIQFVERLGLHFGCIDMIVTPAGDYIFLEINPNGQWLWVEHITKMPISKAIAELLVNPPA